MENILVNYFLMRGLHSGEMGVEWLACESLNIRQNRVDNFSGGLVALGL